MLRSAAVQWNVSVSAHIDKWLVSAMIEADPTGTSRRNTGDTVRHLALANTADKSLLLGTIAICHDFDRLRTC